MTKAKFLEKSREIFGYKYNFYNLKDKIINTDYIDIEYNGILYKQRVNKHLLGKCCEKVSILKTNEEFITESKKLWGDIFDYSLTNYTGANNKVKFITSDGSIIEQIPSLHLKGYNVKAIDKDKFIHLSKLVSDEKYSYEKCDYINKTTNVILTCPEHGDFIIQPFNHLNYGDCCKNCIEYDANKLINKTLTNLNFNFERQKKFQEIELPFDFFIPSIRTCIDFGEKIKIKNEIRVQKEP